MIMSRFNFMRIEFRITELYAVKVALYSSEWGKRSNTANLHNTTTKKGKKLWKSKYPK